MNLAKTTMVILSTGKIKTKSFLFHYYLSYISGYAEDVLGLWKIIKKRQKFGEILVKIEESQFLTSCLPFLAEKREIRKKREREFLVLVATHSWDGKTIEIENNTCDWKTIEIENNTCDWKTIEIEIQIY